MRIIKRSGAEVDFDISKIIAAIYKANAVVGEDDKLKKSQVDRIANTVENQCMSMNRAMSVEEIQDMVEDGIMRENAYEVARILLLLRYKETIWQERFQRTLQREYFLTVKWLKLIRPEYFTSMMQITLHSICTTVTL